MPAIRTSPSALSTSIKAATSAAISSPAQQHAHSSPSAKHASPSSASTPSGKPKPIISSNLKQATLSFAPKPKPSTPAVASSSSSSSSAKAGTSKTPPAAALSLSLPKSAPAPPSATLTPELIAKFAQLWPKLPADHASLLELEMRTMGADWLEVLKGEMGKSGFLDLKRFLLKEQATQKVYPPAEDIYSFTRLSSISGIKLVIIGQDPYHQPNQAHGLSFSVRRGIPVPPSLKNIYKEIQNEYPEFVPPRHGDLTELAKQGVLLLNTALTVRANQAASHSKAGWEPFTRSIISHIASGSSSSSSSTASPSPKGKVFMCWGKHAENVCKAAGVDPKKNLILKSVHPSPLSAHRGFFDTGHFKEASEWLEKTWGEGEGIDWTKIGA